MAKSLILYLNVAISKKEKQRSNSNGNGNGSSPNFSSIESSLAVGGGPSFSNHNCHLFLPLSPNTHHHFFPFPFLFLFPFLSFTSPLSILPPSFFFSSLFFHVFNGGQYANSTPKAKGSVLDKHPVLIFIGCQERCLHFKKLCCCFCSSSGRWNSLNFWTWGERGWDCLCVLNWSEMFWNFYDGFGLQCIWFSL